MYPVITASAGILSLWFALILPPAADPATGIVTGIRVEPASDRTEVVISVQGRVSVRDSAQADPHRVVVDLLGAGLAPGFEEPARVDRAGILTLEAWQYERDVVRITVGLERAADHTVRIGDGYVRIVLFKEAIPLISVSFSGTPMEDVLFTFADFSGRSIVHGAGVSGHVSADIRGQPWETALRMILESHGLAAREYDSGIIRVDRLQDLTDRVEVEQLMTRPFRINYGSAGDLLPAVESLLSGRGRISTSSATNSLVVTDAPSVLTAVEELLAELDLETPEVTISAKIIFVKRSNLAERGVIYDLKDMQGNQLNAVTPGLVDSTGDGFPDQVVEPPQNVISLRGNSIAALGNARQRVAAPSVQFLTSLIMGRMTLLSFVEALESAQLSEMEAAPQVKVLDNRPARIQVGERTPVRGVQPSGQGQSGQDGTLFLGSPRVEFVETGIILEVTPTITASDRIFMDLRAERSGVEEVGIELGYRFNTQEAHTQVLVEDGETVIIGGLTVTEVEETQVGIPILQHLPVLGRAFRFHSRSRTQQDLIIMVTPRITRRSGPEAGGADTRTGQGVSTVVHPSAPAAGLDRLRTERQVLDRFPSPVHTHAAPP